MFPSTKLSVDPRSGKTRHHQLDARDLQQGMKQAVWNTGFTKAATPHTLRHSLATRLLQGRYDIRTLQELLGHQDVNTTMMIYTNPQIRQSESLPARRMASA